MLCLGELSSILAVPSVTTQPLRAKLDKYDMIYQNNVIISVIRVNAVSIQFIKGLELQLSLHFKR